MSRFWSVPRRSSETVDRESNEPNRATRESQQKHPGGWVFPKFLDYGLSILLPNLSVEPHIANVRLLKPNLHEVERHSPSREDYAVPMLSASLVSSPWHNYVLTSSHQPGAI